MSFSRAHPSPRYTELLEQYRAMHGGGAFTGISLLPHVARIKRLIDRTGSSTLLDYGCGKALLYDRPLRERRGRARWAGVAEYWGVSRVARYDPCTPPHTTLPSGTFEGVICTDVLEHCPEPDVPWILAELFGFATKFVFANVACFPAHKQLPNGENAHCTIRPAGWWRAAIEVAAASRPGVRWEFLLQNDDEGGDEERIGTVSGEDLRTEGVRGALRRLLRRPPRPEIELVPDPISERLFRGGQRLLQRLHGR